MAARRNYVLGVGPAHGRALETAAMLAQRLGRGFCAADTVARAVAEVGCVDPASLLIVAPRHDVRKLAMYAMATRIPAGFVTGVSDEEIAASGARLVERLAAPLTDGPQLVLDAMHRSGEPRVTLDGSDVLWVDGKVDSAALRTLLASDKKVMALFAHSDGHSVLLGDSLLCAALHGSEQSIDSQPSLPCFRSGHCGRFAGRFIAELEAAGNLIEPRAIRAEFLLNLTCHGLLLADDADWERSIGAAIRFADVTHNLTFWGQTQLVHADIETAMRRVAEGRPLGEVALGVQAVLRSRGAPALAILLGDPAFCFPATQPPRELDADVEPSVPSVASQLEHDVARPAMSFSEFLLARIAAEGDSSDQVDAQDSAEVLALLARRSAELGSLLMHSWLPAVRPAPDEIQHQTCPNCRGWAILRRWSFWRAMVAARYILLCADCGEVAEYSGTAPSSSVDRRDDHKLLFSFPGEHLTAVRVVLELWPRSLSRQVDARILDGDTVLVELDPVDLAAVERQRGVMAVFAWGREGLRMHRLPIVVGEHLTRGLAL